MLINADQFTAYIEHIVATARDDGLSDEAIIAELKKTVEALEEGLT